MRTDDLSRLTTLLALGAFVGLGIWAADDLKAWANSWRSAAASVQTSRLGECPVPTDGDVVVITVAKARGRIELRGCYAVTSNRPVDTVVR